MCIKGPWAMGIMGPSAMGNVGPWVKVIVGAWISFLKVRVIRSTVSPINIRLDISCLRNFFSKHPCRGP